MGSERHAGIVKWFSATRGYGFIVDLSNDAEYFVHHTGIESDVEYKVLHEKQKVTYELGEGKKGICAVKVRIEPINLNETYPLPAMVNAETPGGFNGSDN